jgi:hypothetical protein
MTQSSGYEDQVRTVRSRPSAEPTGLPRLDDLLGPDAQHLTEIGCGIDAQRDR